MLLVSLGACSDPAEPTADGAIREAVTADGITVGVIRRTTNPSLLANCPKPNTYVGVFTGKDASGMDVVGQACCTETACTVLRVERSGGLEKRAGPSAPKTNAAR